VGDQVIHVLREQGAEITAVMCVIDREAGGATNLAAEGIELRSLFTMSQLEHAYSTANGR
jgi:orotate phosphoribosyltransferase